MDRYIYTMTLKNSLQGIQRVPSVLHDVNEIQLVPSGNFLNIPIAKVQNHGGGLKDTVGILVIVLQSMDGRRVKDQDESITGRVTHTVVVGTPIVGTSPVSNEVHLITPLRAAHANNDGHHAVGVTVFTAAVPFSIIAVNAGIS